VRLLATLRCDIRLQWRNGFYYAAAFVAIASILLLRWLPRTAVDLVLPVVLFANVLTNSFYFVAGLMVLENGEGTRAAQRVTPLSVGEYLGCKLITLGLLSLVEILAISASVQGLGAGLMPLGLGIALASALFTLLGATLVAPYRSINEFIMPSVAYTAFLSLPLLGWFGLGSPLLFAWHPLQGPLDLMGTRVEPLSMGRLAYAVCFPLLCIVPAYLWGRRAVAGSVLP
jgi:fluoroquinolone transport system permease protein